MARMRSAGMSAFSDGDQSIESERQHSEHSILGRIAANLLITSQLHCGSSIELRRRRSRFCAMRQNQEQRNDG